MAPLSVALELFLASQPLYNSGALFEYQVEVKACLSRSKALRQPTYTSTAAYGMSQGGAYGAYGYGAANYGGYGQGYNAYNPYGGSSGKNNQPRVVAIFFNFLLFRSAPWQAAEYQTEGRPYQAGYDSSYAGYYGWGGYSPQDVAAANPYAAVAPGGARAAIPVAAGGAAVGRDQYSHDPAAAAVAARGMTAANPYAATKIRQTAATPLPLAGTPAYNPVRSVAGAAAGPVYGRRAGPY